MSDSSKKRPREPAPFDFLIAACIGEDDCITMIRAMPYDTFLTLGVEPEKVTEVASEKDGYAIQLFQWGDEDDDDYQPAHKEWHDVSTKDFVTFQREHRCLIVFVYI